MILKFVLFQSFTPVQTLFENERHIAQCEQHRNFDQRTDGRCQRLIGIDSVDRNTHGDGQFEAAGTLATMVRSGDVRQHVGERRRSLLIRTCRKGLNDGHLVPILL